MMLQHLKFLFQRLTSSKYIVSGKCKQCGTCCRNITFFVGKKIITAEEEFIRMQNFDKKYKNFEINGRGKDGELLFKCKALQDDGKCGMYNLRSLNCRLYPRISQTFVYNGGVPLDECGYMFVENKKFSEYLK